MARAEVSASSFSAPLGEDERSLVQAAKQGDSEAFGSLVLLHQRMVTRLAVRMLGDLDDGDAAAQDAFVRAWEKLGDFRAECPFGAWVARIVVNICRDRLRRGKLVVAESRLERAGDGMAEGGGEGSGPLAKAVDGRPDPEASLLAREAGRKVAELAADLPQMQREVFSLRYYEERPLAEIAALFSLDVGTIKTHLFRATHRIRKSLETLYGNRFPF